MTLFPAVRPLLVGLVLTFAPHAHPAAAQGDPFETLEVSVAASAGVMDAPLFRQYWRPGRGGEAALATPFYVGRAEVGAVVQRHEAAVAEVPRYDAAHLYLGWGLRHAITRHLGVYGGLRLGNYMMRFDDDTFPGVRNESEFTLGLQARLDVTPAPGWHLSGGVAAQQVFTYLRLRQVTASVGLRHTFGTPGWLRRFLQ